MKTVIDVNELNKYYGKFQALKNVSFKVKKGQIFGYLGSNGSGKTTTIKILLGLLKLSSGDAKILGNNTFSDNHESIKTREKIGAVMDFDGLIDEWSGIDNLIFWGGLYDINKKDSILSAEKLIKTVELEDWKNIKVSKYSKGMKKRLSIARSLISDPQLLILDEPTTGLDPESKYFMRKILKNLAKEEKTIFLSSHDLDEIQKICSHIGLINKGKLIFNGSLKKLSNNFNKSEEFSLEKTYLSIIKEANL
jgi:ABC-2 type transport system ATP-binding protein